MPINLYLYKRRHSRSCLAETQKKVEAGRLKMPDWEQYSCPAGCAWWVRGRTDDGRVILARSTKCSTKQAAEIFVQNLNRLPLNGQPPKVRKPLAEAREQWLTDSVKNTNRNRESTQDLYRQGTKEFIAFMTEAGLTYVDEVTVDLVRRLRAQWQERGLRRNTMNSYRTYINLFFRYCLDGDWIDVNPVAKVQPIKQKRKEAEAQAFGSTVDAGQDDEEATMPLDEDGDRNWQLIQQSIIPFLEKRTARTARGIATRPHSFLALLELMYHTGLRISDACFFDPRKIVDTPHGASYTTRQQKTGSPVTVFFPYKLSWLAEKLRALPPLSIEGLPFWDGRSDWQYYIQVEIRRPLSQLGIQLGFIGRQNSLRPHRFRDSFAINQINEGVPLHKLKDLLGHKYLVTTEKHYLPWVLSRQRALEKSLYASQKLVEMPGTR
jgi:site-specific recombinase XerD